MSIRDFPDRADYIDPTWGAGVRYYVAQARYQLEVARVIWYGGEQYMREYILRVSPVAGSTEKGKAWLKRTPGEATELLRELELPDNHYWIVGDICTVFYFYPPPYVEGTSIISSRGIIEHIIPRESNATCPNVVNYLDIGDYPVAGRGRLENLESLEEVALVQYLFAHGKQRSEKGVSFRRWPHTLPALGENDFSKKG